MGPSGSARALIDKTVCSARLDVAIAHLSGDLSSARSSDLEPYVVLRVRVQLVVDFARALVDALLVVSADSSAVAIGDLAHELLAVCADELGDVVPIGRNALVFEDSAARPRYAS